MEPHKLLHDGQTQAKAAVVSGERRVGLPETVKNVSQKLGFDAQSGVSYRHFEVRSYPLDNDFHSATFGREFYGIGKKVPDDLLKPIAVSGNQPDPSVNYFSNVDPLGFRRRRYGFNRDFGDGGEIQPLHVEPHFP